MLAATVDRLGDAVYLLQALAGVKHPERLPMVPRPGTAHPAESNGHGAPPKMSTREEIRAFFGAPGTNVIISDS